MDDESICTLCDKLLQNDVDDIVKVRLNGLQTFINKSESRQDEKFKLWVGKESKSFHESCRKRYSALPLKVPKRKRNVSLPSSSSSSATNVSDFYFDEFCFICNKVLDPYHKKVCNLQQLYSYQNLLKSAIIRNDEVGIAVLNRLEGISLDVKKLRYHYVCYKNFLPKPSVPSEEITTIYDMDPQVLNLDTEIHNSTEDVYLDVYNYIEESGKFHFFLSELHDIMQNKVSNKVLCNMLKKKYNEDIFILKHRGRETVIYYKTTNLTKICSDWLSKKSIDTFEKNAVVTFAAEILRAEILNANYKNLSYPPAQYFLENVNSEIPKLLQNFLKHLLFKGKQQSNEDSQVKSNIIAHSIVSFLRPRASHSELFFAPKEQLEMVFCSCKTNCSTARCSCNKIGIKCSYNCKNCNGQSCGNASNSRKVIIESDTEEQDDNFEQYNENVRDDEDDNIQGQKANELETEE